MVGKDIRSDNTGTKKTDIKPDKEFQKRTQQCFHPDWWTEHFSESVNVVENYGDSIEVIEKEPPGNEEDA